METAQTIGGELKISVRIIYRRDHEGCAYRHTVIGIGVVFMVVIVIVAAFGAVDNRGSRIVVWIPVDRSGLVCEIDIFNDGTGYVSGTRGLVFQTPDTVSRR